MWDITANIISVLLPLLTAFAGWAAAKLRTSGKRDRALEAGVKMMLRERIIDLGMHYIDRQEIPPFALETIKGMHAAYIELGDGDRSVSIIVERCKNLPIVNGG
ncbi:hypothetical protein B5F36_13685 [Anaerofilum sp. An201]|nr:hypothetical protein [Anaerofilum sp. An201]OUP00543.1 hypothetical protein B5F36_13685 [Anaerofilum sp. An201]